MIPMRREEISLRENGKYVIVVVLLAVLAVTFGILGTAAPPLAEETGPKPQQESPESPWGISRIPPPMTADGLT